MPENPNTRNQTTQIKPTVTEGLLATTLRHGQIPQHVGFIIDGNRRWTEENGVAVMEGYRVGLLNVCKVGISLSTFV